MYKKKVNISTQPIPRYAFMEHIEGIFLYRVYGYMGEGGGRRNDKISIWIIVCYNLLKLAYGIEVLIKSTSSTYKWRETWKLNSRINYP